MIWFKKIFNYLFSLSLILFLLLTAVDFSCFDKYFYFDQYKKLNTAATIGVSDSSLEIMTEVLLSYLKDSDKTLDCTAEVKGEQREIFNEREKDHMVDVRILYQRAMFVRDISGLLMVISLVLSFLTNQHQSMYLAYKRIFILFIACFLALLLVALVDFDFFWTNFHYVFFAGNDLWLLDPRTDILIMMVPSEFFYALVMRIVGTFFGSLAVSTLLVFGMKRLEND